MLSPGSVASSPKTARVALLRLHEEGLIELPPSRCKRPDSSVRLSARSAPGGPIKQPAHTLTPLIFQRVEQKTDSHLWNELIQRYHYLGYKPLPGAQLRYIISSPRHPLAWLGFGAAAWQCAPRDCYIGRNHDQRQRNLHRVVNNARLISWILPK